MKTFTKVMLFCVVFGIFLVACPTTPYLPPFFPSDPANTDQTIRRYVDNNTIRVLCFNQPNVKLGRYANPDGSLINFAADPSGAASVGNTENVQNKYTPTSINFEWYSVMTKVETQSELGVASGKTNANIVRSKHLIIHEWSRYFTDSLKAYPNDGKPLVSAVDRGIAVRIIFDVTISSTDATGRADFGAADLATAIALKQATVQVRYDIRGTNKDIFPATSPNTINSVEQLVKLQQELYDAVRNLSLDWDNYMSARTSEADRAKLQIYPDVIAYYVTGIPDYKVQSNLDFAAGFIEGVKMIARGQILKLSLNKNEKMSDDFKSGLYRAYTDILQTKEPLEYKIEEKTKAYANDLLKKNELDAAGGGTT